MSFYELNAEQPKYFYVRKGCPPYAAPHFHGAIEFLFCWEGTQQITVGGETRMLQKGDACFINSFTPHSLSSSKSNLLVFLSDIQFFLPILHSFEEKLPPTFFRFEDFAFLEILYDLYERNKQNPLGKSEANEGVLKILMAEIAKNTPFEKQKQSKETHLVSNVLRFAAEHLSEDLSLKRLSKTFGYAHTHLSRILHHQLGEHWNRYVGRLRAKEAHALLNKHPDLSVLEIAFQCGFDSPNTFYRAYRLEYGASPRSKKSKTQLLTYT